jgi:hypothetical protein
MRRNVCIYSILKKKFFGKKIKLKKIFDKKNKLKKIFENKKLKKIFLVMKN